MLGNTTDHLNQLDVVEWMASGASALAETTDELRSERACEHCGRLAHESMRAGGRTVCLSCLPVDTLLYEL